MSSEAEFTDEELLALVEEQNRVQEVVLQISESIAQIEAELAALRQSEEGEQA